MISHIYHSSKIHSPCLIRFSNINKKTKKSNKVLSINQNNSSSRDRSINRNITPKKIFDNLHKQSICLKEEKSNLSIDQLKQQLDVIFQTLPKIEKKIIKTNKEERKKNTNNSFEEAKSGSISKNHQKNITTRSKSTLPVKKNCLPRIKKENLELNELQKYLSEFHQKSKYLLSELEQKVLGKEVKK